MANTRTYTRSFAGGEISPEMFGRLDDAKYQTGAATVRNFIPIPQGAAENRPGFQYVSATKSNGVARLIPFTYSTDQTMVIEMGARYFRFHTQGATLLPGTYTAFKPRGSVTFSIASPCVVTWTAHGLNTGDPVVFAAVSGATPPTGLTMGQKYYVNKINANSFNLSLTSGGANINTSGSQSGTFLGQFYYALGDMVSYLGNSYYCLLAGQLTLDPTNVEVWYAVPADAYEVPSFYNVADLFDIHFVQSEDVMTLVHPNYAPAELKRVGAAHWVLTPISFAPAIAAPAGAAASASPGYKAKISSISSTLITTQTNHTLSLGDGIYIDGLHDGVTDKSGFYLVEEVPADPTTGALIQNELKVMDYSGNALSVSSFVGPATIQLASKVFDPSSYYVVTAIAQNGVDESLLSSEVSALNNLDVPGSYNTITWNAVDGALRYYVYKKRNGLYGYIGETTGTTFVDDNIAPDFSITPPNFDTVFGGANDYPAAVSYFEQRRCFAGTNNQPQNIWESNSGTESTFSYSLPTKDTDRIAFRIATQQANTIRHIVPLTQLILLSSSSEIRVSPVNSDVLTPTTFSAKPQSYVGASNVQPTIINNSLVYCAARGGHVRELGYEWTANSFVTGDLSLRAAHLFDNLTIVDQCYVKAPRSIVWFVSSNGNLLGLTYMPEEQIGAWHHHDTDGFFESITSVAEGDEDRLYAVIRRTVNGNTVRYVERMASRLFATQSDCFFVDAGATYNGPPVTTIDSGLSHLEGKTVSILADGAIMPSQVVTSGAITLPQAASVVQVGLPYISDLQTLPIVLQVDGFGQGRAKNINKAWVRVFESSRLLVGPDADHLHEAKQRTNEPWGSPPELVSKQLLLDITPMWQDDGQLFIRQTYPLPLTVVGVTMEVSIGG